MADPKETQELATAEVATEATDSVETRQLYLRDGRTLTVSGRGAEELVEIHASSGMLELRIKMTEQGPSRSTSRPSSSTSRPRRAST